MEEDEDAEVLMLPFDEEEDEPVVVSEAARALSREGELKMVERMREMSTWQTVC